MNKETKEYFEKNPHLFKDLMKDNFEDALKKVSGKAVQIVEKPKKDSAIE